MVQPKSKWRKVSVTIQVERGGELEKLIQSYADAEKCSFSEALSFAVLLGINHHIKGSLALMLPPKNT